jgi:1-phosphofructokinase
MIYTLTLNPALDYTIKLENLYLGKINITKETEILPGGKGINVSTVLKNLEIESIAIGFISGFTGKEIERKLNENNIKTEFIGLENQNSRINIKIIEKTKETAINTKGPNILKEDIEKLYKKIEKIEDGDFLVLSGSIPNGIDQDIYEKICEKLKNKNIKIIVDSTNDLLLKTLKFKPFLIKPNKPELEEIFKTKIKNKKEAIKYAQVLKEKGAKNIIVSMGEEGAIFIDENKNKYNIGALKPKKIVNTVGAGDSMIAGFLAGFLKYKNYEKALKLGISSATATVSTIYLGTKEEILEYFNKI